MDDSNQSLFNALRIGGPIVFFVVVFAVLYKFAELGTVLSVGVAALIAIADYIVLTWLMRRVGDME